MLGDPITNPVATGTSWSLHKDADGRFVLRYLRAVDDGKNEHDLPALKWTRRRLHRSLTSDAEAKTYVEAGLGHPVILLDNFEPGPHFGPTYGYVFNVDKATSEDRPAKKTKTEAKKT
jgi:hypothetical protein